jgi:hypothetical protein
MSAGEFDFIAYQKTFNTGDDDGALEFWSDDLTVTMPLGPNQTGLVASNKQEFRQFLNAQHVGIREVMRLQTLLVSDGKISAEFDMDFVATADRPDFAFGPLKAGEFMTVKMFGVYAVRDGKLGDLKLAFWPPNQGVTNGLTMPWSSGVVEGNVNRVKMLKRQTYGRAAFPRLRKRVLLVS